MKRQALTLMTATVLSASLTLADQTGGATPARHITLEEAVQLALKHNHNVRIAKYGVDEKQHAKEAAKSSYFPSIRNDTSFLHLTDTQLIQIRAGSLSAPGGPAIPPVNTVINQGGVNLTAKELQAQIQPAIDDIHSVSVTVDGQNVKKTLLRVVLSDPFEAALPAENLFGPDGCSKGVPVSPGIYSPAVDGGEYVSLPPLSPGAHTLHFHAESDSSVFGHVVQDVTYGLTVVPVSLK